MAKIKLSESSFKLIPEGNTVFKIMSVDDSKYNDFGKIVVNMQTAKGEKHKEQFGLINSKGELNEGALKAWSYFARTCINDFSTDEIDTQDIVGHYIRADVKHESFVYTKGNNAGKTGTAVRLNSYDIANGFDNATSTADNSSDDLDDLDDLD